jgi:hypothetical protein
MPSARVFQQPPAKKSKGKKAMTPELTPLEVDENLMQLSADVPLLVILDAALATLATVVGTNIALSPSYCSTPITSQSPPACPPTR